MALRKGFLSTLEAVIASTIFFLFLLNAAPSLTGDQGGPNEMTMEKIRTTTEALDEAGTLREQIGERNLTGLQEQIDDYLVPLNVAVGVLYSNTTERSFSGTDGSYTFEGNESTEERTLLRLWIDEADDLVIRVNGQTALRTGSTGYTATDVSDLTTTGTNSVNLTAQEADLDIAVEQYNYYQSRPLPTDTTVSSTGHQIGTQNGELNPAELRVFVWE